MKNNYLVLFLFLFLIKTNTGLCTRYTITASNTSFVFNPDSVSAFVGDTIVFSLGTIHTVIEVTQATWAANQKTSNGGFTLGSGGGTIVVTQAKTYYYVCGNHNLMGMKGRLFVSCIPPTLNLKLFIEGYYLGGGKMIPALKKETVSNDSTVADSITVSLVDSAALVANGDNADLSTVASVKGVLKTNGSISIQVPCSLAGLKYYIRLQHRNATETWSKKPIMITNGRFYDFSAKADSAYGNNQKDVFGEGIWSILCCDPTHDGGVDGTDFTFIYPAIQGGAGGYNVSDLNGDGGVDGTDFMTIYPNIQAGKGVIRP